MFKKGFVIFLMLFFCIFLTMGCGNKNFKNEKSELVEKYNKIDIGMTRDEVDKVLEVSDSTNGKYEDNMITISYKDEKVILTQLQLSYDLREIRNSKTSLSKAIKLTRKINKGEKVYYEDLKKAFKTDGVCITKTSNGCSRYGWANYKKQYVIVSLNVYSDGYVMYIDGKA